jgi:hypothetical protein
MLIAILESLTNITPLAKVVTTFFTHTGSSLILRMLAVDLTLKLTEK